MRFVLKSLFVVLTVSVVSVSLRAQESPSGPPARAYLGARLSSEIPALLRKHLGLEAEQGLLVENIYRNSPADKAGLDKDDILLSLNGKALASPHELFRSIREVGIGGSVTLELIHLGQRRQATITFEAMGADYRSDWSGWKYAIEPDESMVIRPGRMFQMRPGEREWLEIPVDQLRGGDARLPHLGAQYHFLHDDGQKEFTVVIEGNPNEASASVSVKTPNKEYITTAGQIDMLPQEYQQTVRNDIEKAKQSFESGRNLRIPPRFDFSRWQEFFAEGGRPRPEQRGPEGRGSEQRGPDGRGSESRGGDARLESTLEALARQIEEMQERQKALEELLKEKLKQG